MADGVVKALAPGRHHPVAVWVGGRFETGLDVVVSESGTLVETPRQTAAPQPLVVTPKFINAHAHSEYRTLAGQLEAGSYPEFIGEIVSAKSGMTGAQVRSGREQAVKEWAEHGLEWVFDHHDRSEGAGLADGSAVNTIVFRELIDFDPRNREERRKACESDVEALRAEGIPCWSTPHAPHTVSWDSLKRHGFSGDPLSIHVLESVHEVDYWLSGKGWIADWRSPESGAPSGVSPLEALEIAGALRPQTLLVHCCEATEQDIDLIARCGAKVVHCPRSNANLGCRTAPVSRMLEADVQVLLGTDSEASGGDSSIVREMSAALRESERLGEPLSFESVWGMSVDAPYEYLKSLGLVDDQRKFFGVAAEGLSDLEDQVRSGELNLWVAL